MAAVAAAAAFEPTLASAATIIGSPLSVANGGGVGRFNYTFVQTHLTEPSAQLSSPVNGTVVRWSLRGTTTNGEANRLQLRVLAPAAEGKFVGVATSLQVTLPNEFNDDVIRSFATALPIGVGDTLGIHAIEGAFVPMTESIGATFEEFEPFADGTMSGAPETLGPATAKSELLFNAEVVAAPTSSATVPTCSESGAISATVTTDPATSPKAVDFRIDGGATQNAPATSGTATLTVPAGHHTLEYWGEDVVPQQEIAHHTAALQVGGCAPMPPILPAPILPTKPEITHLSQSRARWREGSAEPVITRRRRHAVRPPIGTTFAFELNESARVTFAFTRSATGSKVEGKCVPRTRKNRRGGACQRIITAGALPFTGHAGQNKVVFVGRLPGGKTLKPGSYTLVITAADALGHTSAPQKLTFTIVK